MTYTYANSAGNFTKRKQHTELDSGSRVETRSTFDMIDPRRERRETCEEDGR